MRREITFGFRVGKFEDVEDIFPVWTIVLNCTLKKWDGGCGMN